MMTIILIPAQHISLKNLIVVDGRALPRTLNSPPVMEERMVTLVYQSPLVVTLLLWGLIILMIFLLMILPAVQHISLKKPDQTGL